MAAFCHTHPVATVSFLPSAKMHHTYARSCASDAIGCFNAEARGQIRQRLGFGAAAPVGGYLGQFGGTSLTHELARPASISQALRRIQAQLQAPGCRARIRQLAEHYRSPERNRRAFEQLLFPSSAIIA